MPDKKNILFIMADQLRSDYLACNGHPTIKTPNIDALAAAGVNFTNTFCQSAVCGPSRMSFYTGRYMFTHGGTWNNIPVRVDEKMMGDYLRPHNYRVGIVGKTHFRPHFFNLEQDPEEMDDLGESETHKDIREQLFRKLFDWMRTRKLRPALSNKEIASRTGKGKQRGYLIGVW